MAATSAAKTREVVASTNFSLAREPGGAAGDGPRSLRNSQLRCDDFRELLLGAGDVALVLEQKTQSVPNEADLERLGAEKEQRLGPVEALRDPGRLL